MKSHFVKFINRWRHTHGYGVHSPLAFHIITECIHPEERYAYYADSYIQSMSANEEMRRRLRLMVRLINTFRVENIWMPECGKKISEIISIAYPRLRLAYGKKCPEKADFIVFFNKCNLAQRLGNLPENDAITLLIFDKDIETLANLKSLIKDTHITPTLMIKSRSFSLILQREGMQPVEYNIL